MLDLKTATISANRFGFGAKPGELSAVAAGPREWLKRQLVREQAPLEGQSPQLLAEFLRAQFERKADPAATQMFRKDLRDRFKVRCGERTLEAARTDKPFLERLVQFWGNHFTVSVQRPVVISVAAAYEDEAIRPHVLGRFRDMLHAVAQHPAMLLYLDNAMSVGPTSPGGRLRDKGLNEGAREVMELHTLGVDGGYSQADVTELAKILTGWSINRANDPQPGTFRFRPAIHEPGGKVLLGRTYREDGIDEGMAALDALAVHPATARHIATKLVRHFVSDEPPPNAVQKLSSVFRESGGDLHAVSLALVDLPEIWAAPLAKFKSPNDLVISTFRTFGLTDPEFGDSAVNGLALMGQVPFSAASPAGWPDRAASWVSPEAMMTRIDWAVAVGKKLDGRSVVQTVGRDAIIAIASEHTMSQIDRAPSQAESLALMIASSEFQRR